MGADTGATNGRDSQAASKAERSAKTRRVGERAWYAAGIIVASAVIFVSVVAAASVSPRFCATCHSEHDEAALVSAHGELDCDACHADAGFLGVMEQRMSVVRMVGATVLPGGSAAATVNNERCLLCHEADMETLVVKNGIRMDHQATTEERLPCQRCHPDTGHAMGSQVAVGYTMNDCLQCHNAANNNPATCAICHEGRTRSADDGTAATPWQVTHGSQWQGTHGMGDLDTCSACHASTYCGSCHGIELPHPQDFAGTHGTEVVAAGGRGDCLLCHDSDACDECHGVPMPHPPGFLQGHSELVETEGRESCERCHAQSSCDDCHTRHIHPGLTDEQIRALRGRPAS